MEEKIEIALGWEKNEPNPNGGLLVACEDKFAQRREGLGMVEWVMQGYGSTGNTIDHCEQRLYLLFSN